MNEQQVRNLIRDEFNLRFNTQQMLVGGLSTVSHTHNRVDSPGVESKNLLPYPINPIFSDSIFIQYSALVGTFTAGETVTGGTSGATGDFVRNTGNYLELTGLSGFFLIGETVTGGTSGATAVIDAVFDTIPDAKEDGVIEFYSYQFSPTSTSLNPITEVDWGFNIFLGGQWNDFTIVPSGTEANQDTAQNFPDVTETTLICDTPTYDLNREYDQTLGEFTCTTKGRYLIGAGVTFDDFGAGTGTIELTAYYEFNGVPFPLAVKSVYVPLGAAAGDMLTIDITTIQEIPATSLVYVTVYHNLGIGLTSLINPRTWFNVHKMK